MEANQKHRSVIIQITVQKGSLSSKKERVEDKYRHYEWKSRWGSNIGQDYGGSSGSTGIFDVLSPIRVETSILAIDEYLAVAYAGQAEVGALE